MDNKKRKGFIKVPEYPGGNEAFNSFIKKNLQYPKEAMQKGIEGVVHLTLNVDDNGNVINAKVTRGLGHGIDEEALRLARLIKYGGVKNRGVRVKATKKIRIAFKLSEHQPVKYQYKKEEKNPSEKKEDNEKKGTTYGYTINY